MKNKRGYTLVELIVAIGLFALVMMLASGAYLVMIDINRRAQSIATGINNLSFALETMTRTIRTGTDYKCGTGVGNCQSGADYFSVENSNGAEVTYELSDGSITQDGFPLTDPSVIITSLKFYSLVNSQKTTQQNDRQQPRVTIIVSGEISSGHGEPTKFTMETGATMRGIDI